MQQSRETKSATTASTAVKTEAGARTTKAPAPKSSDDAKAKTKKASPKARASRKVRRGGYPSDSDPNSEDDDSDSSSDDSDSSFCEPLSDMVVPKATQGGTTPMTIRPFVTASSLDDFDEKASLSEHTDIRYKKSERRREQHVKRFTHRLADSQLKSILKSQRFKSMDDLEYLLKQQEDDWDDDRQGSSTTKARDFRAENLRRGRLGTKYPGRAYVTQSGDDSDSDERHVMFEDQTLEISPTQESVEPHEAPPENQGLGMTMEELTQHMLKVMENSGWNKTGYMAHQGKARQSNDHP
ncbi:hypothetical protein PHMEG_00031676 [Phytophthora megakarya]|uniref:Uncharacterized protein n=1 Tax=Phytophthora megakarya TaxID=4795 RepID=A0A225UYV1_9STRA|nr:hypothetical protein PHMEG_00031676 [Phytophthora megakarya]